MAGSLIAFMEWMMVQQRIFGLNRKKWAIKFTLKTGLLLYIFDVYMPCDQYNFIDIYIEVLSEISQYCLINSNTHFVVG